MLQRVSTSVLLPVSFPVLIFATSMEWQIVGTYMIHLRDSVYAKVFVGIWNGLSYRAALIRDNQMIYLVGGTSKKENDELLFGALGIELGILSFAYLLHNGLDFLLVGQDRVLLWLEIVPTLETLGESCCFVTTIDDDDDEWGIEWNCEYDELFWLLLLSTT
jgi:hypothetical protein